MYKTTKTLTNTIYLTLQKIIRTAWLFIFFGPYDLCLGNISKQLHEPYPMTKPGMYEYKKTLKFTGHRFCLLFEGNIVRQNYKEIQKHQMSRDYSNGDCKENTETGCDINTETQSVRGTHRHRL